jgi:2,3-bisphosphoglycerate-dependent phosphoglycerate mutase
MSVQVVYETHSTSEDNEQGFATGWLGGTLAPVGCREQARQLGLRRRNDGVDIVIASDLHRAVETAQIAFGDSAIPIRLDWRLRECNYGAMDGMRRSQFPGGESWREAVERVNLCLRDLVEEWQGKRVLLIGHVATRLALDHIVNGQSLEELIDAPFDWRDGWDYVLAR